MEGDVNSEPYKCPNCGSRNLRTITSSYGEGVIGWETTCEDCGCLVDED